MEVESVSFDSVTFLDIDLWTAEHVHSHDRTTVSIRYKPHFKKTSLGVPLAFNSSHPWHVHASWPFAELRRLRRLSCDESTYENAKHIFVHRLMYNFEPSFLTKKLLEYAPGLEVVKGVHSRQLEDKGKEVKWVVLPFHFVWESACLPGAAHAVRCQGWTFHAIPKPQKTARGGVGICVQDPWACLLCKSF